MSHLGLVQRDTNGLTAENRELKLRLQAMEQQAQLRDGISLISASFWSVYIVSLLV